MLMTVPDEDKIKRHREMNEGNTQLNAKIIQI